MTTLRHYRFRPHEHLRHALDFRRTYARKRSVSDDWLIVYGCENGLPYLRLGLSVSKKYGRAHQRNRLRRLYKEAFRLTKHDLPTGIDLILIPRQKSEPTFEVLLHALPKLIRRVAKKLHKEAR